MDVGQVCGAALRVVGVLCFGGFLAVVGLHELWLALRDVGLRLTGERVRATVTDIEHEREIGETTVKHWVEVRFTTRQGRELERVRLRNWTSLPPRVGARVRVSYRPDRPQDADRAQLMVAAVTVLFVVPFCLGSAALITGFGLGLWGE